MSELADGEEREYFRPNFFANTPDILHAYLVARRPRRRSSRGSCSPRTLCPSYGIYSRLRALRERARPRRAREEYLNSEKYEIRKRALDGPLLPLIRRLNAIRRDNPALQHLDNVTLPRHRTTTA